MKSSVGAIHEAAFLFEGSPRIKKRQDIAPTDGSIDRTIEYPKFRVRSDINNLGNHARVPNHGR